jgi:hypothetical protein
MTVAFFAIVSVAAGAVALTDDDSSPRVARDADDRGEPGGDGSASDCASPPCEDTSGGTAGICLEGAVDCDDTPVEQPPDGDVCIQIFPTPPECVDPDAPVSNGPPSSNEPTEPVGSEPPLACTMEYPNKCTATAAAIADLAERLRNEDQITVKSIEFVEWPDSCLGITKRDIACAEIITPGFRVLLEANGQTYEYHTDGGSRAVFAE